MKGLQAKSVTRRKLGKSARSTRFGRILGKNRGQVPVEAAVGTASHLILSSDSFSSISISASLSVSVVGTPRTYSQVVTSGIESAPVNPAEITPNTTSLG